MKKRSESGTSGNFKFVAAGDRAKVNKFTIYGLLDGRAGGNECAADGVLFQLAADFAIHGLVTRRRRAGWPEGLGEEAGYGSHHRPDNREEDQQ